MTINIATAELQFSKKYNVFSYKIYKEKRELIYLLQVFIGAMVGFAVLFISIFSVWSFYKPNDPIKNDYQSD